jgi:hypothetical protein
MVLTRSAAYEHDEAEQSTAAVPAV